MFKKFFRQKGQSLVFFAIALPTLFMFVGAAADFGWLYYNQSRLQNAADAAVVAGANRLTADEQSLSDYTYTTFVSNNEKGLLKLIESDSRVKTRDSKAGDTIAIEYVKKNLSDNS